MAIMDRGAGGGLKLGLTLAGSDTYLLPGTSERSVENKKLEVHSTNKV